MTMNAVHDQAVSCRVLAIKKMSSLAVDQGAQGASDYLGEWINSSLDIT